MVENGEILQRTSPEDRNMTFSAAISLIPVFSGIVGGKSYRDFSKAVAAAGQLAGCTDLQLAQAARIKLEGPASEYLDSHPDMEKAGWNKIDEALKSHFQNEPSVEESKARLMKAAQVDGESVREFATRIRLLGCKLLKLVDGDEAGNKVRQDILNQDMLTYFLKGLRADIKRFVHTHQPANLEEATRYAQAEESFLASVEQPMSILKISTPSSDRPISPSPSPPGQTVGTAQSTAANVANATDPARPARSVAAIVVTADGLGVGTARSPADGLHTVAPRLLTAATAATAEVASDRSQGLIAEPKAMIVVTIVGYVVISVPIVGIECVMRDSLALRLRAAEVAPGMGAGTDGTVGITIGRKTDQGRPGSAAERPPQSKADHTRRKCSDKGYKIASKQGCGS
ncbi:LOW QUALITY PROTEIN: Zinc finger and SCAN domain-containing protein 21 [Frankliniella fusca]|uniref:Zinc finger and SCAN domain-containing protein 21 n=1 Tax=Frankliniella fusca TaxID=407009 RepID=A0AAE1I3Y2_9NEOP|nr:LOW QUALITY PROTEIN: Zinc finger and SCAN domain-containing protein 21 [Frankliniella fusca]